MRLLYMGDICECQLNLINLPATPGRHYLSVMHAAHWLPIKIAWKLSDLSGLHLDCG